MAALQKIRSKSSLLVGIIGIGLLTFIFPWGEVTTFINQAKNKAFVVNGTVVTTQAYAERIEKYENFQKLMTGQSSLDEQTTSQIREGVYQQMVKEMILDEEAENLGIAVTTEELNDMVYGQQVNPLLVQLPLFMNPQTRQFDKSYLMQFLTDINQDLSALNEQQKAEVMARREMWAFIQNLMKYQRLEEKYSSLVAGSFLASDTEIKATHDDSKNIADIAYVYQKYTTLSDSTVQVTDKELKELYDQRKNNYKLNGEQRKISFFIKDVVPSDEDYAVVEKEINAVYEKLQTSENPALLVSEYSSNPFVDAFYTVSTLPVDMKNFIETSQIGAVQSPVREDQSFVTYKIVDKTNSPDSVRLRIIPIPQSFDEKTVDYFADSIMTVVKGGKDFGAIAEELYPGDGNGLLDWGTEMNLASIGLKTKEAFSAAKGEIFKLAGGGQTLLVRVEDRTAPVSKVKLAIIEMPVLISDRTQNTIDNELNMFVAESGNVENFDKAAMEKGYNVVPNATISPSDMSLGQASGTRQVIHWAFNEKVGEVKKFDLADKRIVAISKEEISGDYLPIAEVLPSLRMELINNKKAEKIIADLKAKNLTSLDAYAQAIEGSIDTVQFVTFSTNNIAGVGYEPVMNVQAKIGQVGKITEPLQGRSGVYVLSILDKKEDTKDFDLKQAKLTSKQNNFYQLMSQSVSTLREKMKVEDNRVRFW